MGRNNGDFNEAKDRSVGSEFGDIWVQNEPHSRFAVPHPEKPGELLKNPTRQMNPEHWVPIALDLEKRKESNSEED